MQQKKAMPRHAIPILIFAVIATVVAAGTWRFSLQSALTQTAERGQADLSLASDRLLSELQQYREIAVLTADRQEIVAGLTGAGLSDAHAVLQKTADKTGTLEMRLVAQDGRVLVSSNYGVAENAVDRSKTPAFRRAMQGALGAHHARIEGLASRAYVFSAPVFRFGDVIGVVEVDVNMWAVESEWIGDPQAVFFTDEAGVVFLSNRTELLFLTRHETGAADPAAFGYTETVLRSFIPFSSRMIGDHEVWKINGGPYLPKSALHITKPLPTIDMTGELLLDISPAERVAGLQAAVAAALVLIFGGTLLMLVERRRALTLRLESEAAANAALEHRVAERTAELSQSNAALLREIAERREAEQALKRAQDELVQAGKLSALGQMSAGLSHELNQPLMAIRSFAENAELFLDRGAADKAAGNLQRISDLARRMGRIIKNLRAFSRQESEPISDVDLVGVVEAALELAETSIADRQVQVHWKRPEAPVYVRGGEVRLQQVVLNLISNGIDAMAGMAKPSLYIELFGSDPVCLTVRDTGPGIGAPDKVFDPFYTTKEVGQSEGMGLGLSISYGLVQSFGGDIRGTNLDEGGAMFTVELRPANAKEAA